MPPDPPVGPSGGLWAGSEGKKMSPDPPIRPGFSVTRAWPGRVTLFWAGGLPGGRDCPCGVGVSSGLLQPTEGEQLL